MTCHTMMDLAMYIIMVQRFQGTHFVLCTIAGCSYVPFLTLFFSGGYNPYSNFSQPLGASGRDVSWYAKEHTAKAPGDKGAKCCAALTWRR